jgi:hypothetical protein
MVAKTKNILLACCLLICLVNAGKTVTMTCASCVTKTGCLNNLCQKIVGDGISIEECAGLEICPASATLNFQLAPCSVDYSGNKCTTGICYYMTNSKMCISNFTSTMCSSPFWASNSCGACAKMTDCSQCYTTLISTSPNSPIEACVDISGCSNFPTNNITIGQCSDGKDSFGTVCSCCADLSISINNNIGLCTSSIPALAFSTTINVWAKS